MNDSPQQGPQDHDREDYRIEVTVTPTRARGLKDLARIDLDRVPDPEGGIRLLVSPEQLRRLEAEGFEVTAHRRIAVEPLDPSYVFDDKSAQAWLTERLAGVERQQKGE